eukprot:g2754.t1
MNWGLLQGLLFRVAGIVFGIVLLTFTYRQAEENLDDDKKVLDMIWRRGIKITGWESWIGTLSHVALYGTMLYTGATCIYISVALIKLNTWKPHKMFLELWEEDGESMENVQAMLNELLRDPNLLSSMTVCEFLSVSSSFAQSGITILKEGRCHAKLYDRCTYAQDPARKSCTCMCLTLGLDFSFLRCSKGAKCCSLNNGHKRWAVVTPQGVALFHSPVEPSSTDFLTFDSTSNVWISDLDRSTQRKTVVFYGSNGVLSLSFRNMHEAREWVQTISVAMLQSDNTKTNDYGSFAGVRHPPSSFFAAGTGSPARRKPNCQWLVDGEATFSSIYHAILQAKKEIFICGWWLQLDIPLDRSVENWTETTLGFLLNQKAHEAGRNIQIYVLLYKDIPAATRETMSHKTCQRLKTMGPNVHVLRHRSRFSMNLLWSHHEKVVCVDQQLAFLGGLDICPGRFDSEHKCLFERGSEKLFFPGLDYRNPMLFTPEHLNLHRGVSPRVPWADIHMKVCGQPAGDIARHFVERWNYARMVKGDFKGTPAALCRDKNWDGGDMSETIGFGTAPLKSNGQTGIPCVCRVQIVRSISRWSGGCNLEASIHEAYCNAIQGSSHFIYIENQFFCTGCKNDEEIGNRIGEALRNRIVRAHKNKEKFRVMVVLPLFPEVNGHCSKSNTGLRSILHWQLSSINLGKRSLLQKLKHDDGVERPEDYIRFFSQRVFDTRPSDGKPFTSLVYIHTKTMIVDDRIAIIGSANINDRSMLGIRDSELAAVVTDNDGPEIVLGGDHKWRTGKFAHSLRMKLFERMLSRSNESIATLDLASSEGWNALFEHAGKNTEIYENVFPLGTLMPSNKLKTWEDCRQAQEEKAIRLTKEEKEEAQLPARYKGMLERLRKIQGTLVVYPINFLVDEANSIEPYYEDAASFVAPSDLFN